MKRSLAVMVSGLAVLTAVLYWPALRCGVTNWDDSGYLNLANQYRLSWAGVKWAFTNTYIYYQPLTWLSHGLDCALWGLKPAGHHAQSIVWHVFNTGLVVWLTWQLSRWAAPWDDAERLLVAGWVGLVFAIHPLQVEAVVWLAGRKTLLSTFFCLLALLAYVRWVETEKQRRWWLAVVLGYGAALFSKPMAVPLPVVLLALDVFPLRRVESSGWWKLIREKWLLWIFAGVVSVLTVIGQAGTGALTAIQMGPGARLLVAARGLVFYLWKLVWPAWLSPFYPLGEWNDLRQPEFIVPAVLVVIVTGVIITNWKRAPQLAAAWLAYVVLLLPVSGLFQAGGQAVADRFAYLPVVAVLLLVAGALVWMRRKLPAGGRGLLLVAVGGYVIWLAARTQQQIPVWQDDVSLWKEVVARVAASTTEYGYAATALVRHGSLDEALPYAAEAYRRLPGDADSRKQVGEIYRDLALWQLRQRPYLMVGWLWFLAVLTPVVGITPFTDRYTYVAMIGLLIILAWLGQDVTARFPNCAAPLTGLACVLVAACTIASWRQTRLWKNGETLFGHALAISQDNWVAQATYAAALLEGGHHEAALPHIRAAVRLNPTYATGVMRLGEEALRHGRTNEAEQAFWQALQISPRYPPAHLSLAQILAIQGKTNAALEHFELALRAEPDGADIQHNYAKFLADLGRTDEAASHYQLALQLDPASSETHYSFANLLAQQHHFSEAIAHYQQAIRNRPDYAQAHVNLGNLLLQLGQGAAASDQYRAALRADPTLFEAHFNLAEILKLTGNRDEAIVHYREAARLQPDRPEPRQALAEF